MGPVVRRDFFLIPDNYKSVTSPLVVRFGELIRKIWNTRNFKGQVRGGAPCALCLGGGGASEFKGQVGPGVGAAACSFLSPFLLQVSVHEFSHVTLRR